MSTNEARSSTFQRVVTTAGVVVLSLLGTAAWWLRRAGTPTEADGGADADSFSCSWFGNDPASEARALEICRRQAADAARRAPRPSQVPGDPDALRIDHAIGAICLDDDANWACDAPRSTTEADVATVRAALTRSGYPDAVVRLERPGDPAPDGSVVYAVRLPGDRCVVAYAAPGLVPGGTGLSGLLPSGECLAA